MFSHFPSSKAIFEPKVDLLGSYSITADLKYTEDGLGLRVLKPLPNDSDLNLLTDFKHGDRHLHTIHHHRDKVGNCVNFMVNHPELVLNSDGTFNVDVVCGNGILHALLLMVDFEVLVTKYKGVLFIRGIDNKPRTYSSDAYSFAGYKFEELISRSIDNCERHQRVYNVYKVTFGSHTILQSAEIDCLKFLRTNGPKPEDFVEIKTIKKGKPFMYSKWWAQCYLSGVKDIVVGIKDEPWPGMLRCNEINVISMDQIEQNAENWSPLERKVHMDNILNEIKKVVQADDRGVVYKFSITKNGVSSGQKLAATDIEIVLTYPMSRKLNSMTAKTII